MSQRNPSSSDADSGDSPPMRAKIRPILLALLLVVSMPAAYTSGLGGLGTHSGTAAATEWDNSTSTFFEGGEGDLSNYTTTSSGDSHDAYSFSTVSDGADSDNHVRHYVDAYDGDRTLTETVDDLNVSIQNPTIAFDYRTAKLRKGGGGASVDWDITAEFKNESGGTVTATIVPIDYGASSGFSCGTSGFTLRPEDMNADTWTNVEVNAQQRATECGLGTLTELKSVSSEVRAGGNDILEVDARYDNLEISPASDPVSGRITTQDGVGVANATVHVTGVDYSNINPKASQTLEDRADELLDEAENPLPKEFDRSLDVRSRYLEGKSEEVPLAYTREDIATAPWTDQADLVPPRVVLPADEPVVLAPWNPDGNTGLLGNEYSNQLPGKPIDKGPVIVEQIGPSGSVTQKTVLPVSKSAGGGLGDPSSMKYAETRLSPGIYRISLKGDDASYYVSVGKPEQIAGAISDDLEDEASQLSERAKAIRDRLQNNKFTSTTVETNETGHYTAEVGTNVDTVAVEAYKAPDVPIDPNSETHPRAQIRNYVDTYSYNGSIYLPSKPTRYQAPTDSADVQLREVSYTPYGNTSKLQDRLENLENLLENQSQRLESVLQQQNASRETLESTYRTLNNVSQHNDAVRERANELLGEDELTIDPDEATDAELRARISALEQALQEQRGPVGTLPIEDPEPPEDGETVSVASRFAGELTKEQVTVIAHLSNGTSMPVEDEYIRVDQSAGTIAGVGSTTVYVEEYPLGDAASAQFEWIAARENGIGRDTERVDNPLVNSNAPDIDSVRVSTLAPGPDDTVSVELNPSEESEFRQLTSATVYGPSGQVIPTTNITDGQKTSFVTNGNGVHTIQLTYENVEGTSYTKTVRLGAAKIDQPRKPSVRAQSGPTGVFALVGDGLDDGDVTVSENGDISVSATVADEDNPPGEVHVYSGKVDTNPTGDITARLVGSDGAALNHRAWIYIHAKSTPDDGTYVYRNGDQPITTGGNQWGTVTHASNQTLIKTYTNANGEASVTVKQPNGAIDSTIEAARWQYYQFTAGFNVPILSGGVGFIGLGLVLRRRKRGAF